MVRRTNSDCSGKGSFMQGRRTFFWLALVLAYGLPVTYSAFAGDQSRVAGAAQQYFEGRSPERKNRTGGGDDLRALATALFSEIARLSEYSFPEIFPRIRQISHTEIERLYCTRRCGLKAVYDPSIGISLDQGLDPANKQFDRSILLHELVHHLQAVTGRYAHLPECIRRYVEEREAYAIQNAYLSRNEVPTIVRVGPGPNCGDPQAEGLTIRGSETGEPGGR
jgi:hypothetical protein